MRWPFVVAAIFVVAFAGVTQWLVKFVRIPPPQLHSLTDRAWSAVKEIVERGQLARPDGHVYAVDVAQLMTAAARAREWDLYSSLRALATANLITDLRDGVFQNKMVAWRFHAGGPLDASGTTETLRLAEALLLSRDDADHALALELLDGYARHAGTEHGVWLICNYYNPASKTFATNTFLVDYDPDLIASVAATDSRFSELSRRCTELVSRSGSPCGLIYDMVQPEVLTLAPDTGGVAFSPNDVVQLSNAATVAERCVKTLPAMSRRVLDHALAAHANGRLKLSYLGRTGEPLDGRNAGLETYGALIRLSRKLGDEQAAATFEQPFLHDVDVYLRDLSEPRAYRLGEILLTLTQK